MRPQIKRLVIELYCLGLLPAVTVSWVFAVLKLRSV